MAIFVKSSAMPVEIAKVLDVDAKDLLWPINIVNFKLNTINGYSYNWTRI